MLKRLMAVCFMAIMLAGGSMARAAEGQPTHLAVIDEVLNSGEVLYTIYPGMSLRDLRENFKGATQWTIADGGEIKNYDPNKHSHIYYVYRNIGKNEPLYETICITSDVNNESVWHYHVTFFTSSEKTARTMFNKISNEYKIRYGTPNRHRGKYRTGMANDKREMFEWDSMESYDWSQKKVVLSGWEHMEGRSAEFLSQHFRMPQTMYYRVYM